MPNPYLIIALLLAWAASLVGCYRFAAHNTENATLAAAKVAQDAVIADFNLRAASDLKAAVAVERKRQQIRTVTNTIVERIQNAPSVPVSCNLDPASLLDVRSALRGPAEASSGQSGSGVPQPAGTR